MPRHIGHNQHDRFPTDPSGLPEAGGPELLELAAGDSLQLRVEPWQSGWASRRCGCWAITEPR